VSFVRTTIYCGTGAAVLTLSALALLSRAEGRSSVRPINATSHVFRGTERAARDDYDPSSTVPGFLINTAAGVFWSAVYALMVPRPAKKSGSTLVLRAALTSVLAAVIDYALLPKRLRPGWELALRPRSVALSLASMGCGIAAGGLAAKKADTADAAQLDASGINLRTQVS